MCQQHCCLLDLLYWLQKLYGKVVINIYFLVLWKKKYRRLGMLGTTVACTFIRRRLILMFVANVGDSAVILGKVDPIKEVTAATYHEPYVKKEKEKIEDFGGSVKSINQVMRVIPEFSSQEANDKSWLHYRIPLLNMTRSLGDLWSFKENKRYLISPIPDVFVHYFDPTKHKFIILASDGLLDVMEPQRCVELVHDMYRRNYIIASNVSTKLLEAALKEWEKIKLPADNLSFVTS